MWRSLCPLLVLSSNVAEAFNVRPARETSTMRAGPHPRDSHGRGGSWSSLLYGGMQDRRHLLQTAGLCVMPLILTTTTAPPAVQAESPRFVNPGLFDKGLLNVPPRELIYPDWMEGTWETRIRFLGADFPGVSARLSRERILQDTSLAGFRRASIVMAPDVGKAETVYVSHFVEKEDEGARRIVEDKRANIQAVLDSELGRGAVTKIEYDVDANANRATISLYPGATPNADRIELFWNTRTAVPTDDPASSYVWTEDIRQVNISPRLSEPTTIGDYRHAWELTKVDEDHIKGYLVTAAYATPQDGLFEAAPFKPLVFYFQAISLTRLPEEATNE